MLRRLGIVLAVLAACQVRTSAQIDSARASAIDGKIEEYVAALAGSPAEDQQKECDFMIMTCRDSLVRQHVALKLYDHYLNSKIMGDEAMAVHISDTWFATGKVKMASDIDLLNARIFADFNRSSLIGCQAPQLTLLRLVGDGDGLAAASDAALGVHGDSVMAASLSAGNGVAVSGSAGNGVVVDSVMAASLSSGNGVAGSDPVGNGVAAGEYAEGGLAAFGGAVSDTVGADLVESDVFGSATGGFPLACKRWRVLYFYDIDCAKCAVETPLLVDVLARSELPLDFYAVFTGSDLRRWRGYAQAHFSFGDGTKVRAFNFADPDCVSDFPRKYGVLQTPRLFLIDCSGTIIGRGLSSGALKIMIDNELSRGKLSYGSDGAMDFYDGLFFGEVSAENIDTVAAYMAAQTLGVGDTVRFRQMTGDLLYWLSSQKGAEYKAALGHLIDRYILPRGDVWRTADDSLKVIGVAEIEKALLGRTPVGSRLPDLTVPATLWRKGRGKAGDMSLRSLRGRENYILFLTEGCPACKEEREAAIRLSARRGVRVLLIDTDAILADRPELAGTLFDNFDLSALPYVIRTDRGAFVRGKYISLMD